MPAVKSYIFNINAMIFCYNKNMRKIIFFSAIMLIFFYSCAKHRSPEAVTFLPTQTPVIIDSTANPLPAAEDISAQKTKTCFPSDTNSCPSASGSQCVATDSSGCLWAGENAVCAVIKKYSPSGEELFSYDRPQVYGIAYDPEKNWLWYTVGSYNNLTVCAGDAGDFNAGIQKMFTLSKTADDGYYGLDFDGSLLWMTYTDYSDWYLKAFSEEGILVKRIKIHPPVNGGMYWGITHGEGYIWFTSFDYSDSYIYKMDENGVVSSVCFTGEDFLGMQYVSQNTFWTASWNDLCKINY